jgi:hypothetical protein
MMFKTKEFHLQNWEILRAKGKYRYILRYGVLLWALPAFLVTEAVRYWRHEKFVWVSPVIWFCMGIVYGLITFTNKENRYQKYK